MWGDAVSDFVVLVSEEFADRGWTRFWAVEGGADTAARIEEITGCSTRLVPVLSFDSFLTNIGKHDPFREVFS